LTNRQKIWRISLAGKIFQVIPAYFSTPFKKRRKKMDKAKEFFTKHVDRIISLDTDVMVDEEYHEDAVLVSPFPIYDEPAPYIIRGNKDLKAFFHRYREWQGNVEIEKVFDYIAADDVISFSAIVKINTGRWVSGVSWYLRDGKIAYHFSWGYRLDPPE
jgi:hypothetical protein